MGQAVIQWGDDVRVSIRTVVGRRDAEAAALLRSVSTFCGGAVLSPHRDGRTVPESYADALAAACGATWALQLEDDAILAPDFDERALELLDVASRAPRVGLVSFYSGRRIKPGESLPESSHEILPGAKFLMAQAFAMRSELVDDHNAFMLEFTRERPYATDTATATWMKARGLRYVRAWPSIVQHMDLPSLSGHRRNPNRFSESFRAVYGGP